MDCDSKRKNNDDANSIVEEKKIKLQNEGCLRGDTNNSEGLNVENQSAGVELRNDLNSENAINNNQNDSDKIERESKPDANFLCGEKENTECMDFDLNNENAININQNDSDNTRSESKPNANFEGTECSEKENSDKDKPKLDFEGVPTVNPDGTPILFNGVEVTKLTKTQLKKYKRMVKWEAGKKEKRAKERQRMKLKIKEAKLENKDLGPSRKALKKVTMANSACKINVVVDMSFDDLMISKDIGKVIKQTLRMYTKNRRSLQPMQLHLTSFEGKVKEEMSKHDGYENWDMHFHEVPYLDVFPKDKLVYLSSESENVITKLEDDKVYIIGGLVDHNSHKGVCYKKAVEQGISHGQLPISEYFHFKTRKVFTINQVFEILLEVSLGKTFKEAFELTLPKRINMQPKEDEDSGGGEEEQDGKDGDL